MRHRRNNIINKKSTKMRKGYTILRKNVDEVETKLATVISFPPQNPAPKFMVQELEQQLGFVQNLVSAELASHGAPSPPRHLRHISARLDAIHTLFQHFSAGLPISSDAAASSCPCTDTESCLEDDDEDEDDKKEKERGLDVEDETTPLKMDLDEEESEFEECLDAEIGYEEKEEEEKDGGLYLSRVVVVVVVFGVVLIVVGLMILVDFCFGGCVEYYNFGDYGTDFLVPT